MVDKFPSLILHFFLFCSLLFDTNDRILDLDMHSLSCSVNEETFWRNYFYRVSLLKQSTQANSLNKGVCKRNGSTSSSEAEGPDEVSPSTEQPQFIPADSFRQDSTASASFRQDTVESTHKYPWRQDSSAKRQDSLKTDGKQWQWAHLFL